MEENKQAMDTQSDTNAALTQPEEQGSMPRVVWFLCGLLLLIVVPALFMD
jgi:hypothetical protein